MDTVIYFSVAYDVLQLPQPPFTSFHKHMGHSVDHGIRYVLRVAPLMSLSLSGAILICNNC